MNLLSFMGTWQLLEEFSCLGWGGGGVVGEGLKGLELVG